MHACRCSFYEIYNEQVFDLAVPDDGEKTPLNVREAADKGVFLEGLTEEEVSVPTKKLINRTYPSTRQIRLTTHWMH